LYRGGAPLRLVRARFMPARQGQEPARSGLSGQSALQRDGFLQRAQRRPHRLFEPVVEPVGERLGGEAMPDMTAKQIELAVLLFPQRAAAFRTGERREDAVGPGMLQFSGTALGDVPPDSALPIDVAPTQTASGKVDDQRSHIRCAHYVVELDI